MREIWFKAIPFDKGQVTLALEAGVDGIITEKENTGLVRSLSRIQVLTPEDITWITLRSREDEQQAVAALKCGAFVLLTTPWEIIPIENILAQTIGLAVEVENVEQAALAAGILEHGVERLVISPAAISSIKTIVLQLKMEQGRLELAKAKVLDISNAGLGHRVCIDTMTKMCFGQGMLVGDSSSFTFLVLAETEKSPYVAPRPFRINAGAVHAYALMPDDRTAYLDELQNSHKVLIVSADGRTNLAVIGRVKVEVRPMLRIRATVEDKEGSIFLQNAETIRLCSSDGQAISVTSLEPGQEVLVRLDQAGRHFGMRLAESIEEK